VCHLLKSGATYRELASDYFDRLDADRDTEVGPPPGAVGTHGHADRGNAVANQPPPTARLSGRRALRTQSSSKEFSEQEDLGHHYRKLKPASELRVSRAVK
jgi:hypothetical protein